MQKKRETISKNISITKRPLCSYKICVKVVTREKKRGMVPIRLKEAEPRRKLSTELHLNTDRQELCLSSGFTAFHS